VQRLVGVSLLVAAAGLGAPTGLTERALAQTPAETSGDPRVMSFAWTLYPRMWAELDLHLAAAAEAMAEITVEGGEVSWNLHTHASEAPTSYAVLAHGVTAGTTVRCAPDTPGLYSYLFGNDRRQSPVRIRVQLRLTGDARLLAVKP
jgi:hypothetical protein